MFNTGIDLIEIERIKKFNNLKKIYTLEEIKYINTHNSLETKAGIFAAKEALLKSLSCGINDYSLLDIEVLHNNNVPYFKFYGNLSKLINDNNLLFSVSISHDGKYAIAIVIVHN